MHSYAVFVVSLAAGDVYRRHRERPLELDRELDLLIRRDARRPSHGSPGPEILI